MTLELNDAPASMWSSDLESTRDQGLVAHPELNLNCGSRRPAPAKQRREQLEKRKKRKKKKGNDQSQFLPGRKKKYCFRFLHLVRLGKFVLCVWERKRTRMSGSFLTAGPTPDIVTINSRPLVASDLKRFERHEKDVLGAVVVVTKGRRNLCAASIVSYPPIMNPTRLAELPQPRVWKGPRDFRASSFLIYFDSNNGVAIYSVFP